MTIFNLLAQSAQRYADGGAVYLGSDQLLTYGALHDRSLRLAGALSVRARPGDRVMIASKNCPEFVEIMFAIWAAGMVAVPVNAKLHAREMVQVIEDAEPALIFTSRSIGATLAEVVDGATRLDCVTIGGDAYLAMTQSAPIVPLESDPDDLAWLFFTSGTTGRSKGAMLSHRNLATMAMSHLADFDAVEGEATLLHAAPMSHGSGLYLLPYIARGARQVVPRASAYDPAEFVSLCNAHPSVAAFLAPTMVQRLRQEVEANGVRPANLSLIVYGGGPMYLDEIKRSLTLFGPIFAQLYGQGESPMTITGMRRNDHLTDDDATLGSVGWARSGVEVAIFDEEDRPVAAGVAGEIVCRGEIVMRGYWKNPAATAETLRNGWLHTGDVGFLSECGRLTLQDRSKDLVISGGTNIYPREVEEALLSHPAVVEVAVVGQPDPDWGEIVVAFVVTESGATLDDAQLDAHCLERIARFKRPKIYHYIPELPKSSYGKVLKRELAEQLRSLQPVADA